MLAINALKGRRSDTPWSTKEIAAFDPLRQLPDEAWAAHIAALEAYYAAPLSQLRQFWGRPLESTDDFRRRDVLTLLNNWAGEVDRAGTFAAWREKNTETAAAGRL